MLFRFALILLMVICMASASADDGKRKTLTISLLVASAQQRDAFQELAKQFESRNPNVGIAWIVRRDDTYKADLPGWLESDDGPDLLYWHAGARLQRAAQRGYLEPIDDIWQNQDFDDAYDATVRELVTYNDRIYGIPYSYYQWGFYYRESVFEEHDLMAPKTWDELVATCETMRAAGIAPFSISSFHAWPTAAWFDYINLRINGLAFHRKVVAGSIAFTDPRIRTVLEHWKVLLDKDCFVPFREHSAIKWEDSLPPVYRNLAGMLLMGNFLVPRLPDSLREDIRFFPFPVINASVGQFEEAPTDLFMLPRRSKDNVAARNFLAFIGGAKAQTLLNNRTSKLSTNREADIEDDYFIQQGASLLQSADGLTQFFDRDARKSFADPAMEAFRAFMDHADIERVIQELERARRTYQASAQKGLVSSETPLDVHQY